MDDDLIVELAKLAVLGVHDPARMPFSNPWTRGTPDEIMRGMLAYQWQRRTAVAPQKFRLEYAVLVGDVVVGSQGCGADDWQVLRRAHTGSWLGREFQGQGIGTRMRMLMLQLLFDGLGAVEATSTAFADNPASNAVSRRVGYLDGGSEVVAREGAPATRNRFRMPRERWLEVRADHATRLGAPVVLEGTASLREQLDELANPS
ncbi:GNAT family N-acetyltransferase [Humibacter ginsenosidimutans]|uniref:GNAT family N-acetyltransferase n=2 Tax=Humibacter ginsenosidimutans TaxID=2599293 RepID=A0A5B8MB13_9MICO|nr:GNAT family N-acetyltransferase [Humibacter ginsenosidimutans]